MIKSEAYTALRRALDELIEQYDKDYVDYFESSDSAFDYVDGWDRDEVIARFRENYSSRRMGFQPFDHLDGKELSDALLTKLSKQELADLIFRHCEPRCRDDIHVHWNDMITVCLGEQEYQVDIKPDSELAELIEACTPEERRELLGTSSQTWDSFLLYGRPCELLAFKLEPKTFLKDAEPILRSAGLIDPDDESTEA